MLCLSNRVMFSSTARPNNVNYKLFDYTYVPVHLQSPILTDIKTEAYTKYRKDLIHIYVLTLLNNKYSIKIIYKK